MDWYILSPPLWMADSRHVTSFTPSEPTYRCSPIFYFLFPTPTTDVSGAHRRILLDIQRIRRNLHRLQLYIGLPMNQWFYCTSRSTTAIRELRGRDNFLPAWSRRSRLTESCARSLSSEFDSATTTIFFWDLPEGFGHLAQFPLRLAEGFCLPRAPSTDSRELNHRRTITIGQTPCCAVWVINYKCVYD